jgi:hypothetical protein
MVLGIRRGAAGPQISRAKEQTSVAMSQCTPDLVCTKTTTAADGTVQCTAFRFPVVSGTDGTLVSAKIGAETIPLSEYDGSQAIRCGTIDFTKTVGVSATVDGGGVIAHCKSGNLSESPAACPAADVVWGDVDGTTLVDPCGPGWSQLSDVNVGLNYAQYWKSSCNWLAKEIVAGGYAQSAACNYDAGSLGLVATSQTMQIWPNVSGSAVSAGQFVSNLACQISPSHLVTDCKQLGNLCNTNLLAESLAGAAPSTIEQELATNGLKTVGAVFDELLEALEVVEAAVAV